MELSCRRKRGILYLLGRVFPREVSEHFVSMSGQGDKMVLMVSEIPVQDANLKDLPQSSIFLLRSLFANS